MSDRTLGWFIYLLAVLVVAGLVHIVTILALPHVATRDSYARLATIAQTRSARARVDKIAGGAWPWRASLEAT